MEKAAKRGMVDKVKDAITGLFTSSEAHPKPAQTKGTTAKKTATKAATATKKAVKEVKAVTKKVTKVSRKAIAKKKR